MLIIAQLFPPDLGGSTTRAYNMAKGLSLNGCKVTVVTAFPHYPHGKIPKEYRWRPLKVEWLGKVKVIRTFIFPLESKGLARRMILFGAFVISSLFALPLVGKVDVVWAANPDIIAMMPALFYGKVKRTRVTSNVDDLALEDLYDLKLISKGSIVSKLIEIINRISFTRAEIITPISPGYIETISRYGAEKSKIHVVRGGVDLSIFKPAPPQRNNEKKKFTVLYTGAFSVAYNFDQVLEAAKILEEKDNKIEFILQGKGELTNHIKSQIKQQNLKNVKVIDTLLRREKVAELLNQADALILPLGDYGKPHLGISAKLYEYQAVGKPILCCSSGTPGVYVSETQSGIVVKPGDHEALAKSILYLREDLGVTKRLGECGRRYVEENLSIEKIGLEMKNLFETLT